MSNSKQTRKIRTVDVYNSLGWLRQKPWPHQAGDTEERISHLVYDLPVVQVRVSVIWAQTLQDDLTYSSLIYTVMTSGSSIREMVSTIGYGNVEEEGQDVKYNSEMLQLRCGAGGAETMFGHVLVRNANLRTYLYYFCEREAPFRRMMVCVDSKNDIYCMYSRNKYMQCT